MTLKKTLITNYYNLILLFVGSLPNLPRGSLSANTRIVPLTTRCIALPPGGNSVRPMFHLLRIFHSRLLSPDGREVRFNFPGQTCPDLLATLTRSTSAADDSDSLDNLTRQTLAIRRIHLRRKTRKQLWQLF